MIRPLLLLYGVLNAADVLLTLWGASLGAVEVNPLPLAWKLGSVLLVVGGSLYVARHAPRLAVVLVGSLTLVYAFVVAWNLAVIFAL
jgi:hypothetical protein